MNIFYLKNHSLHIHIVITLRLVIGRALHCVIEVPATKAALNREFYYLLFYPYV